MGKKEAVVASVERWQTRSFLTVIFLHTLLVATISALAASVMGFQDFILKMIIGKGFSLLFEAPAVSRQN